MTQASGNARRKADAITLLDAARRGRRAVGWIVAMAIAVSRGSKVDRGIPVEEPERLERESDIFARHHGEILWPAKVCRADRMPQHDVGVHDGPVLGGPGGQPGTSR